MPAMLTTWWLWLLFAVACYGAVVSDKRVNWEGERPRLERKDGVLGVVLLLTAIPSLAFGATFPHGSSVLWPLAAFAVVFAAYRLRMKATGVLGPWFSGRLSVEPGQVALDDGPYRVIRHPGYLGVGLYLVGLTASFALWPPVLASAAVLGWFVVKRIKEEEPRNRDGIGGYDEYMQKVRWRLIPGVW